MKKQIIVAVSIVALTCFSIIAFAAGIKVNEKIEIKKGEKVEREGQIEKSQQSYVYLIHAEKGQSVNLAAVFRGNFNEDKPNAVFRDNTVPPIEIRGLYKSEAEDAALVGTAKDGKWSGTITESGDYVIVVSRPDVKGGKQEIYPYKLLVWVK
ncbi:MAG TPA: hypothetical protein VGC76_01730 [Pyrinomonadaceae bacterium]|jgi:hypothetical protein